VFVLRLDFDEFVFQKYSTILELFRKLLVSKWDTRFDQIEVVILMDLNRVLSQAAKMPSLYPRLLVRLSVSCGKITEVSLTIVWSSIWWTLE
jgi:hypothetical protein